MLNGERGSGCIAVDGERLDPYFTDRGVQSVGFAALQPGQRVAFIVAPDPHNANRLRAERIRPIGCSRHPASPLGDRRTRSITRTRLGGGNAPRARNLGIPVDTVRGAPERERPYDGMLPWRVYSRRFLVRCDHANSAGWRMAMTGSRSTTSPCALVPIPPATPRARHICTRDRMPARAASASRDERENMTGMRHRMGGCTWCWRSSPSAV